MFVYNWTNVRIELHTKSFDGISQESVKEYLYTPVMLENEPVISIPGNKDMLDYVLTIQSMNEGEIVFFDSLRSDAELLDLDRYESRGVLILHEGDTHKTPVCNISYNKSYWYEVSLS